ncbi:MAG TPA: cytochrome c [Verrucomicrobiae bacterium]|jgi:mono/diheme cytochrome c family protein
MSRAAVKIITALAALLLAGCRPDMFVQPKSNPLKASDFFADGGASRPLPDHAIARGHLELDEPLYTGKIGTNLAATLPVPLNIELLRRGRERFDINCSPCHGRTGEGNGMVALRGFPAPPTFHQERLRDAPIGHFFDVITHGYGVMHPYAQRVELKDRWAVAAYIRALQLSQNARPNDAPAAERAKLESK